MGGQGQEPAGRACIDWQGKPWDRTGKAAHPNSRFTAPARQCPSMSPRWEDPQGVPLSAIVFGGRRARLAPLVFQSRDWAHGVFVGATMGSETTAAATGQVGVVRRDPMAMLPFCGYNMGDYFAHWLRMGRALSRPPASSTSTGSAPAPDGRFLWPGFGENLRVLLWMIDRVKGKARRGGDAGGPGAHARGPEPRRPDALARGRRGAARVDRDEWAAEVPEIRAFFDKFGDRLPQELSRSLDSLSQRADDRVGLAGRALRPRSTPPRPPPGP